MKWSYVHAKLFSKGFHEQCMPRLKENSLKNIFLGGARIVHLRIGASNKCSWRKRKRKFKKFVSKDILFDEV